MAWTLTPNYAADCSGGLELFGQLVFSGNYAAGGDGLGSFDFKSFPAQGFGVYRKVSSLTVDKPPLFCDVVIAGLYVPLYRPGTRAINGKIQIFDLTALAELASGPYPVAITSNPFHTLSIAFPRL